jgi:multisubunit Na+/H+ antiporter MnhG subunit
VRKAGNDRSAAAPFVLAVDLLRVASGGLIQFNDSYDRTHAEVLALLDAVIAKAEAPAA